MRLTGPRLLALLIATPVALCAVAAGPVTVTFDDIDASQADIPIVSPYQGLDWNNVTAYSATPGFDGFNNAIVSGPNAAYGGGETSESSVLPVIGSITAHAGQSFDFLSAYLGAGYYDGLSLTVTGLSGGATLFTRTLTLNTTGAVFVAFGFTGLDTLTFAAARTATTTDPFACGIFNCTQFTLDDMALVINDVPSPPSVPEPATSALLIAGFGLVGLQRGAMRRRRSRIA